MSVLFDNVKVGDTVHYKTPQGQAGKGKVVIHKGSHLVLNAGGKHGRPQVVTDKNYVKHSRGGKVVGALLSRLTAEEKLSPAEAKRKAIKRAARNYADARRVAAANRQSPYKLGEPQMNAAKAFGWVKEARNPSGPYGGDPHDWDPVLRNAIFAAAAKKEREKQVKRGQPVPHKLDTGRTLKMGAQPYRRGVAEDSKDAEGAAERVAKTKKHKKKLHELNTGTLASYVSKAIADRKKAESGADMARRIHTPDRAAYFVDKMGKRANKRSKGIKTAVAKIAKAYEETEMNEVKGDKTWQGGVAGFSVLHSKHGGELVKNHMARLAAVGIPSRKAHSPYEMHSGIEVPKKYEKKAQKILYGESVYISEQPIDEVAAPGKEEWIKANKARFIARYGKEKGTKILYAKAWKMANEARESEWSANIHMAQSAGKSLKPAKGHYLMRDGRKLSGPHSPEDAVKAYKNLSSQGTDTKGVKIVHVKEDAQKQDKYKLAVMKAVSLKKKAKGNKHVDTEPTLKMPDKGTNAPLEGSHADQGADDAKI